MFFNPRLIPCHRANPNQVNLASGFPGSLGLTGGIEIKLLSSHTTGQTVFPYPSGFQKKFYSFSLYFLIDYEDLRFYQNLHQLNVTYRKPSKQFP